MNDIHRVLVVAAHPDDEMLGCGGTLARLRSQGAQITLALLGEGPTARTSDALADTRNDARISALSAAATLDIHDVRFAGFPDNKFDTIPLLEVVQHIESVAQTVKPHIILTHFAGDMNLDHQITHRAVMTAFRSLPDTDHIAVLSFEVLSSTEYTSPEMGHSFHPTLYVDISDFLDQKQSALQKYASEMRPSPHPRSHEAVEHLAHLRGSQCGRHAAEAFVVCRITI